MFSEDSGTATLAEITRQARSCEETLNQAQSRLDRVAPLLPVSQYSDILITGCGSSHHLAMCASFAWSEILARPVAAVAASELLNFPEHYLRPGARPLVLAISRSGGTTEVKLAVERLRRDYGATAIAVTGETGGSVASVCDVELAFAECYERSVVMTQAFTCMLVGFYLLADSIAGGSRRGEIERIPACINQSFADSDSLARTLAEDPSIERFVFLGSGALKGLADESALKVTEMAIEYALSYRTLEFRHGPKAALDANAVVIVFPVEAELPHLQTLVEEIDATGARTLVVMNRTDAGGNESGPHLRLAPSSRHRVYGIKSELGQIFLAALYAHLGQLLAYWRAIARNENPDAPRHLARTVVLDA